MSDLWEELHRTGRLTPGLREAIVSAYGDRGKKALQILDERRVKRYLDFFVVVGGGDEYIVEDDFCTCADFLFRRGKCAHILAVRLADALGEYETFELWYQDHWDM